MGNQTSSKRTSLPDSYSPHYCTKMQLSRSNSRKLNPAVLSNKKSMPQLPKTYSISNPISHTTISNTASNSVPSVVMPYSIPAPLSPPPPMVNEIKYNSAVTPSDKVSSTFGFRPSHMYHNKKQNKRKSLLKGRHSFSDTLLKAKKKSVSRRKSLSPKADIVAVAKAELESQNSNGITGVYISAEVARTAFEFWVDEIEILLDNDFSELAMLNYTTLFTKNSDILQFFIKTNLRESAKKFLAMIGQIIVALRRDDWNMFDYLIRLGQMHSGMGVKAFHYKTMLESLDESFSEYFGRKFTVRIKYAFELVLSLIIRIMERNNIHRLNDDLSDNSTEHKSFLKSIDKCIDSDIGFQYLERFLQIELCGELVTFLKRYKQFRNAMGDEQRLIYARQLINACLKVDCESEINISHTMRKSCIDEVSRLISDYRKGQLRSVRIDLFDTIYCEIRKLIQTNFWRRFTTEYTLSQNL